MLLIFLFCWSVDAFLVSGTTQSTNYSLSSFVQLNNVHNLDTNANYITIQAGINDLATLDGHTIFVEQGTYYENVVINKSLSLIGERANLPFLFCSLVNCSSFLVDHRLADVPYFVG